MSRVKKEDDIDSPQWDSAWSDMGDVKNENNHQNELIFELKEKILSLEDRNRKLAEDLKTADSEKRYSESELFRIQKDHSRLRAEMERLKSPPLIVGTLKDMLPDKKVVIKSSTGPDFIVSVSEYIPAKDMVPGARVSLNKQTLSVMSVLPASLDPIVSGAEVIEKPDTNYESIGGLRAQMVELREAVEDPLLRPELYKKVGIEPPKGVLLVGPPGTGKTLMAKAVANATQATFIRMVGSELVQKYIGEGARLVRELFELAKEKAPSIIFIDELDSVGAKRLDGSTSGDREVQRTLMQLLAELDGFTPMSDIKIIGATNRPDILDDALLRPGRFDRVIEIGLPDAEGRREIFRIHTKKMSIGTVNLDALALATDGASGAEIKSICTEAGMFAIRDGRDSVTMEDFNSAKTKVMDTEKSRQSKPPAHMFA